MCTPHPDIFNMDENENNTTDNNNNNTALTLINNGKAGASPVVVTNNEENEPKKGKSKIQRSVQITLPIDNDTLHGVVPARKTITENAQKTAKHDASALFLIFMNNMYYTMKNAK